MANKIRDGQRPRKRRTDEEKRRIVAETDEPGMSVSVVARRHDVNANQLFSWRRQYRRGELGSGRAGAALVPVGVLGKDGIVSALSDLTKPKPEQRPAPQSEPAPPALTHHRPPKMIEVELHGGTKIRIDADVRGSALQQVLKLIRSLA